MRPAIEVHDTFPMPAHGFTCFHCGETFKTPGAARNHFGFEPSADPACRIKIGAERGLVMALRKAEAEIEELRRLLHDETCEAARLYYAQQTRHRAQLMAVEESGYERGLDDGRNCPTARLALVAEIVAEIRDQDGHGEWYEVADLIEAKFGAERDEL